MKNSLFLVIAAALMLNTNVAKAQGLAINTTGAAANTSAALDVSTTTSPFKGVLVPRMTSANMNAISTPATGLMVFCSNCSPIGFWYYTGAAWTPVGVGKTVAATVTTSSTISGTSVLYPVNDGLAITLPLANTAGQELIIMDATAHSSGIQILRQGSNTITDALQGQVGATSVTAFTFRLVSDGNGHWYSY